MKLTVLCKQSLASQNLVESARRILWYSEENHRVDALTQKAARHVTDQSPSQPESLVFPKQVDFAQYTGNI